VHWNLLGHVEIPNDHIELLYRGGNVLLGSIADVVVYLFDDSIRTVVTGLTCWLAITGIISGLILLKTKLPKNQGITTKYALYVVVFSLLNMVILLFVEISHPPDIGQNILFIQGHSIDTDSADIFYRAYVFVVTLCGLLVYLFRKIAKLMHDEQPKNSNSHVADENGQNIIVDIIIGFRNFCILMLVILLVFLPTVYGLFKYPNIYSPVEIVFKNNHGQPEELLSVNIEKYLLYASPEIYVIYIKSPNPKVLRINQSAVSGVTIGKPRSIFTDLSITRRKNDSYSGSKHIQKSPSVLLVADSSSASSQGSGAKTKGEVYKPAQKQKTSILELLKRLSSIRPLDTILIRPHGKTLLENLITFEWECIDDAEYFIIRVVEEHVDVGKDSVEIWRSDKVTAGNCMLEAPVENKLLENKQYYWLLDIYRKVHNGPSVIDTTDKQSFVLFSSGQISTIERELSLKGVDHGGGKDELYMSLVKGVYYYSNEIFYHARKHFEKYVISTKTNVYSFPKLIYDVVQKLEKLEQERQNIILGLKDNSGSTTNKIQTLKKLISTEFLMLQFDNAIVHIDELLSKLPEAEKGEFIDQRDEAVALEKFMQAILPQY
jgi:hypothetical protein